MWLIRVDFHPRYSLLLDLSPLSIFDSFLVAYTLLLSCAQCTSTWGIERIGLPVVYYHSRAWRLYGTQTSHPKRKRAAHLVGAISPLLTRMNKGFQIHSAKY